MVILVNGHFAIWVALIIFNVLNVQIIDCIEQIAVKLSVLGYFWGLIPLPGLYNGESLAELWQRENLSPLKFI